ncbi:MAG: HIT domain-containing protein [Malacoplasma sp.]
MFFKKKSENIHCEICDIINGKIKRLKISENDFALSFLDVNPLSDGHSIVASKKHYSDLSNADDIAIKSVFSLTKYTTNKIINNLTGVNDCCFLFNEKTISGQKYNHFYLNIIPKYNDEILDIKKNILWIDDLDYTYEKIMKK